MRLNPGSTPPVASGAWTKYALKLRTRAMYGYAVEFHTAALKTGSPLVRAYLLAQTLELYLKSFLLSRGVTSGELKTAYGHNLTRLLADARKRGLHQLTTVSSATESALSGLDTLYRSGRLRYFTLLVLVSPSVMPDFRRLFRFAQTLRKNLGREHE